MPAATPKGHPQWIKIEFSAPNLSDLPGSRNATAVIDGTIGGHVNDMPELKRDDFWAADRAGPQDPLNGIRRLTSGFVLSFTTQIARYVPNQWREVQMNALRLRGMH